MELQMAQAMLKLLHDALLSFADEGSLFAALISSLFGRAVIDNASVFFLLGNAGFV